MKNLEFRILNRIKNSLKSRASSLARFKLSYSRFHPKAFTLVETLVAISILSLAITGPMSIAQKGISSAIYARDQVTAFYLAQEAVESVRNVRDTNRLTVGTPWLSQFSGCIDLGGGGTKCLIDGTKTDLSAVGAIDTCPSGVCPVMTFDTVNKFYGYGSGANWITTPFTREIVIEETVGGQEAVITVTIKWNTRLFSAERSFTVKEIIFNF